MEIEKERQRNAYCSSRMLYGISEVVKEMNHLIKTRQHIALHLSGMSSPKGKCVIFQTYSFKHSYAKNNNLNEGLVHVLIL